MKPSLKDFPEIPVCETEQQRLAWAMRVVSWKIDFEKALINHCVVTNSGPVLYTTITVKELLGK